MDRFFWVTLRRFWPRWKEVLVVIQPNTVVRWHRQGFRKYWTWKSRRRHAGRPGTTAEIRALVRRMDISIFIAATQLRGRPGVVPKPMTASQPLKTPRADACPRFEATSRTLLPPISRHRGPRGSVAYAARCAGAHTSPSQRPRVLGSPPSMCLLAVRHPRLSPPEVRAPRRDPVLRSGRGDAGWRR